MDYNNKLFYLGKPNFHLMTVDESLFESLYIDLAFSHKKAVIRTLRGFKSTTVPDFFNEAAAALQFPYYFGENWDAFDECITDLTWLQGEAYLLMIRNANLLLCTDYDNEEFKILMRILSNACEEWLTPNNYMPRNLPPTPFHVLLQCNDSLGSSALSRRLLEVGVEFEPLIFPERITYLIALVRKLNEILSLVSEDLSEKQLGSIRANINMDNEYILALESLSSILYEHKLSIPSRAYNLFQEVGEALSLKSEIWEILKPQVTD